MNITRTHRNILSFVAMRKYFANKVQTICLLISLLPLNILANTHWSEPDIITQITRTITGRVIDNKGVSLIGANVKLEDQGIGVVTDIDGNFTLKGNVV